MARNGNGTSTVRRLHRSLGAVGAIFLLWMALSGLVINHSETLGLAARHVSQPLLLDWYGLGEPERVSSFRAGGDWLSFAGSQAYFNGSEIAPLADGRGVVRTAAMLIAAGGRELLLLDHEANLVERMSWTRGGAIERIGLDGGAVVIRAGGQDWVADEQVLTWRRVEPAAQTIRWSTPESPPAQVHEAVTRSYRGNGLSLQRVLLDAHSGRIFGNVGVLAYDLLALATIFLAISGLAFWWRSGRKCRRKNRR